MSLRLAAYAVCIEGGRVLLARHVPPVGQSN
ncbi:NUDIX hydrolase, partial [Streptomyces chrestomyceticus]